MIDREVIIGGVSFHERWEGRRLVFRHANVFRPERLPWRLRRRIKW